MMRYTTFFWYLFIVLFTGFWFTEMSVAQKRTVAKAGDLAPDFSLVDFQGKKFTFVKEKNDKVRVFWFTNLCVGCRSVILEMEKIKKLFEKKQVEIVAISQLGEDRATVERIVKEKNLTFRFLYDPQGEATSKYSGAYTPGTCPLKSLYIVRKNGFIQFASHFPGVPPATVVNEIEKALVGK